MEEIDKLRIAERKGIDKLINTNEGKSIFIIF